MKNEIIVSTWGIGPSYRKRVKNHILESINSGYSGILDYVVLTDYPEDFKDIEESTGKIKAIIDINDARKECEWSTNLEPIPSSKDEKGYAREYQNFSNEGKTFSYGLHRFSFPTISELGYSKIVFLDPDVKLRYDKIGKEMTEEQFWKEFNYPVNSMTGVAQGGVSIKEEKFTWAMAMGYDQSTIALQVASLVLYKLNEIYNTPDKYPLVCNMPITEGPFRFYNFSDSKSVKDYFEIWNKTAEIILSTPFLKNSQICGGYMLCDYMIVGIANLFWGMQVLNFPYNTVYDTFIHFEDRFFLSRHAIAVNDTLLPADTQEEYMEKNAEVIAKLKLQNKWPFI